ncbi:Retrovirus-related Pol polyprotein from transposon TNT 1-94 [Senna tora]|uniref:Retrovirus-related Pol polyprotein from transposon TNT 1-94 n=1 Tax=Senna tora TaxID=362788 RepID=A0A834X134_9FABA|nr:Retrovirus-related Pol polyprotein from transposon TNT 1-94 [Senna tora]
MTTLHQTPHSCSHNIVHSLDRNTSNPFVHYHSQQICSVLLSYQTYSANDQWSSCTLPRTVVAHSSRAACFDIFLPNVDFSVRQLHSAAVFLDKSTVSESYSVSNTPKILLTYTLPRYLTHDVISNFQLRQSLEHLFVHHHLQFVIANMTESCMPQTDSTRLPSIIGALVGLILLYTLTSFGPNTTKFPSDVSCDTDKRFFFIPALSDEMALSPAVVTSNFLSIFLSLVTAFFILALLSSPWLRAPSLLAASLTTSSPGRFLGHTTLCDPPLSPFTTEYGFIFLLNRCFRHLFV